jgi:ATP-dependent helicase HrpB
VPPPFLPVDSALDDVRAALDRHRAAVLTAAPGSGKTTRVPPALVDRGRVLLLQPRRVAARAMAQRIADERGWAVGREIGWHIRFDRKFTPDTRLVVVTEGILTAYLREDPLLSGFTTLIVDEFHERNIHADIGLALAKQAWRARDDLAMVVMSATLDTAPVAAFLDGCLVIEVPGALHPLAIDYAPGLTVAQALERLLPSTSGDVLCFLAGAGEIASAQRDSERVARAHGIDLVPLHGSLDAREQDAALRPGSRRRGILATNIAETSLTVPGVSVVIDTGFHKVARYDADRGVDSLTLERITLDSADQRAGRAARLGPGTALRLWDARDRLRPHREPEIDRIDLSGPLLAILATGNAPASFEWFDRPADDRMASAMSMLERLGAVSGRRITDTGRKMDRVPLPPRLARIFLESYGAIEGLLACAWLSEPTRLAGPAPATTSDLLTVLDRWRDVPAHVKRIAEQLDRLSESALRAHRRHHMSETELRRALLAGYPDRVAKRRSADKATLASGHGALIGRESGVHDADWLIALDVTAGRTTSNTEAIIRVASRIEPEWLTPTHSTMEEEVDEGGGARVREVDWYESLRLKEHELGANADLTSLLLGKAWLERGPDKESRRLLARLAFAGITIDLSSFVTQAAIGAGRVQDIVLTEDHLPWETRQRLLRQAPATLRVPSGRDMRIEYEHDGSVSVSVKLQELFGLADTPLIGPARVPVTFHLLAPNGNVVQTTRDLKSFWERTYLEVRKELRGRYPKHPWPDDPWTATPTHRAKRRT